MTPHADRDARLLAQRELARPLLVEAGAGTGKTATLVARILAWTLGPGWDRAARRLAQRPAAANATESGRGDDERIAATALRGVVAITFTEAAAAEMAERVSAGLADVAAGRRPVGFAGPGDEAKAAALLGAADQLQVRTIHSFCRKLLAEHPFEAGLHPQLTVDADGAVLREVVEETVEAALVEGYGGGAGEGEEENAGDPDYLLLAGRGVGPVELADAVEELAAAGLTPADLAEDPLAGERRAALAERLWEAMNRLLTLLEVRRVAGSQARNAVAIADGLGGLRRRLRRARRGKKGVALADLQAWLDEHLPPRLDERLKIWARGETANRAEQERLASARNQLVATAGPLLRLCRHLRKLDPELLASARRTVVPLLERVQTEMRRRGVAGFADLLRDARRLAEGHPELIVHLRRRIDQLLVDEFQDTDRIQCDLIRRLALEGPVEERPGLFVVGDPKQSIYGWRSADLAAYEDFAAAVEAAGGERLTLDQNFRSRPAILDEVERVVAPVMRREPGVQPEFRALVASRTAGEGAPVEHWISWTATAEGPQAGTARETGELEARALVADLLELHRAGTAFRDVGLLLRSTTDLEIYLAALREAGIPFVVSRDRQYYRRREVIDASALLRAVLAPEDQVALVAFLRSVVVGVPDAALLPLWAAELPRRMTELEGGEDSLARELAEIREIAERVAAGLSRDIPGIERVRGWEHNLAEAAAILARLRHSFETEPADVFVDRLRRSTLFEAFEGARYLGVFRLANLDRFFTELLTALEDEAGDRHRVLRRLRRRVAEGYEAEEARPGEAADDAVRILTIHKAKGLEFDHVYLLQMHKEAGRLSRVTLEHGTAEGRTEYRLFGAATLGFDLVEARTEAVARAELVRMLYVAMTRASERLVLVGRPPVPGEGAGGAEPLERAASHMDLLLHRRGAGPTAADLTEMWSRGAARQREDDVVFYLPGLAAEELAVEALEPAEAPRLADAGDVVRTAQRLRRDREEAARRMERPFRQVASKLGTAPEAEAGERPAEARRSQPIPADAPPPAPGLLGDRRVAVAAGSAIHLVFETFDLAAEVEDEVERQRRLLPQHVALFADDDEAGAAFRRALDLFDRFAAGPLLQRFTGLRDEVVARELPVLLPPGDDAADPDAAVGYLAGIVDLVYRDPGSGEIVVADFKTDAVTTERELHEHCRRYAAQGAVYTRALHESLALDAPPRFELWFVAAGRVEVVA